MSAFRGEADISQSFSRVVQRTPSNGSVAEGVEFTLRDQAIEIPDISFRPLPLYPQMYPQRAFPQFLSLFRQYVAASFAPGFGAVWLFIKRIFLSE
jgi:hypothetical protein